MKTYAYLWHYLAEFCLELEMFRKNVVGKIKTHILFQVTFVLRKQCRLWDNVGKYGRAGQAASDTMHAPLMLCNRWYRYAQALPR
jgi:hypothetical protein